MDKKIEAYIAQVTRGLLPSEKKMVTQELRNDLSCLIDDLRNAGLNHSEACDQALKLFGRPAPIAISMFQIHTMPKLLPTVQACIAVLTLLMFPYTMRLAAAEKVPELDSAYGCEAQQEGTVCLPDRNGWVAFDDIRRALDEIEEPVQMLQRTSTHWPGVSNGVATVELSTTPIDVPLTRDHLLEARLRQSGIGPGYDPNIISKGDQEFIRASALFEILAVQTPQITVEQQERVSAVNIDDLRFEFPYRHIDPADEFLWREVGYSLYQRHGLTVAAQSKPIGQQHPVSLSVDGPGTFVLVFRHPSGYGAGYVIAKSNAEGVLYTELPTPVSQVTTQVKQAWWYEDTLCVIRLDGRIELDQILTPNQIKFRGPNG